jgi:protocatechuate 3,4-dioxygenase, beta subunit
MHLPSTLVALLILLLPSPALIAAEARSVPLLVIGGPCEGCELVVVGIPETIESDSRIAPVGEVGEALILEGTVRTSSGSPAAGVIIYAYHTDRSGVYPRSVTAHGRLRGWARTDQTGHYRFTTIRPGAYPDRSNPQHIHMHVIESDGRTYYLDDVTFDDDRLLTPAIRRQSTKGRGGSGVTYPNKGPDGVWQIRRDVVLGENIPGYKNTKQ